MERQEVATATHDHEPTARHVSRCPACWEAVAKRHAETLDAPPRDADRMRTLFGCDEAQRDLFLLAGVEVAAIPAAFPGLAYHLSWCVACREDAAELLDAAAAVASDPADVRAAAAAHGWAPAGIHRGDAVIELASGFAAAVRRGVAVFTSIPAHLEATVAPAGMPRGMAVGAIGQGQRVQVPLAGTSMTAELALDAFGEDALRLQVSVTGPASDAMAAQVFIADDGELALVGAEPVGVGQSATFRGLPAGRYVVEIHERSRQRRFRVRLHVQSPP